MLERTVDGPGLADARLSQQRTSESLEADSVAGARVVGLTGISDRGMAVIVVDRNLPSEQTWGVVCASKPRRALHHCRDRSIISGDSMTLRSLRPLDCSIRMIFCC